MAGNQITVVGAPGLRAAAVIACLAAFASCDDPTSAGGVRTYTAVTTGGEHTCAISDGGDTYCWGRGLDGELGTGSKENRSTPEKVTGNLTFSDITAGENHTCALTTVGEAYCWGWNAFFQRGNTTDPFDDKPIPVTTNVRFKAISAGAHHTCAIGVDSLAYCWGNNRYGQLGDGTLVTNLITRVSGGLKFAQISSGSWHTCGVTIPGAGYCWGSNDLNQLGSGSTMLHSTTPVAVAGSIQFIQIDGGQSHTCGVSTDTRFYCWGSNEYGEAGDGGAFKPGLPGSAVPSLVSLNFQNGRAIYAGASHSCAIAASSAARCWGRGYYGQLGNGSQSDNYFPQPLLLFRDTPRFTTIALGGTTHACGIIERNVFCWGNGGSGQLGSARSTFAPMPQRVD